MKSTKLMATCPRVFQGTLVRLKIRQIIRSQMTFNNYKNHRRNYNFMREKKFLPGTCLLPTTHWFMETCFRRLRRTWEMYSLSKSKINSQAPPGVRLYPQAQRTACVLCAVHTPCSNNPTGTGQNTRISEAHWIGSSKIIKFKKKKKIQFLFILTAFPGEEFYNVQIEKENSWPENWYKRNLPETRGLGHFRLLADGEPSPPFINNRGSGWVLEGARSYLRDKSAAQKLNTFQQNALLVADTFSRHQITPASTNVTDSRDSEVQGQCSLEKRTREAVWG